VLCCALLDTDPDIISLSSSHSYMPEIASFTLSLFISFS